MTDTHKITTPITKAEVELKSWITGREAEYIDELQYEALQVKADMTGKADIGNIDIKKIVTETNHRLIETFVISVNQSKENNLDTILDMPEEDTQFVIDEITRLRKKKSE